MASFAVSVAATGGQQHRAGQGRGVVVAERVAAEGVQSQWADGRVGCLIGSIYGVGHAPTVGRGGLRCRVHLLTDTARSWILGVTN